MISRLLILQARKQEIEQERNDKQRRLNKENINKGCIKLDTKNGYPIENGI
jgi:hypothetical protein